MEKKITIEKLAEMTQNEFRGLEARMDQMVTKELFKEGFDIMLSEIKGLRTDMLDFRGATRIEYAELANRVDVLEKDVRTLKHVK